jgi:hypothetical protein
MHTKIDTLFELQKNYTVITLEVNKQITLKLFDAYIEKHTK